MILVHPSSPERCMLPHLSPHMDDVGDVGLSLLPVLHQLRHQHCICFPSRPVKDSRRPAWPSSEPPSGPGAGSAGRSLGRSGRLLRAACSLPENAVMSSRFAGFLVTFSMKKTAGGGVRGCSGCLQPPRSLGSSRGSGTPARRRCWLECRPSASQTLTCFNFLQETSSVCF